MSFSHNALVDAISFDAVSIAVLALVSIGIAAIVHRMGSRRKYALRKAPGSKITLGVSDDFSPADRFAGFVHDKSGTSIVLLELPPEAFEQLQELDAAKKTFEAQGVSRVSRLRLPRRRREDYIFLRGEQNTPLVQYAKYVLIFREAGLTGMVAANVPRAALTSGVMTGAEIETILASARVRGSAPEAPRLFTLSYLGPFEEDMSILGTTKGYRLKPDGASDCGSGEFQPLFLVAPSLSVASIPNRTLFAERSFDQIDQIGVKTLASVQELTIVGLPAVEAVGSGADISTGAAAIVYQLIIEARHGGYFRLIGLAPESSQELFLAHFRKIAQGFSPL